MRGARARLTVLMLMIVLLFGGAELAVANIGYGRNAVGTNMAGYMLYGTGNYARIYIYPNAVSPFGRKVNSIYLTRADGLGFAESGFQTIPVGSGEISFTFAYHLSRWAGPKEFWGSTVTPGTYPDTNLVVSGSNVKVYCNQTFWKTLPDVRITTGCGIWGVERKYLSDNGNGSFRYCQYKTSSGWVYWPYGVANYGDPSNNNDPQIHFVRTHLPASHWAHFDY